MGIIDYSKFEGKELEYPLDFVLHGRFDDPGSSEKKDIKISFDGNFIFIVNNSVGIYSIDVSDITNPSLFQVIKFESLCETMFIPTKNNNFIYLTNA